MVRAGGRLILLFIVLALVCAPAFLADVDNEVASASEPTRIANYTADFTVADDGDLHVTEVLLVDFPSYPERHGIFRFWDTWDPAATFKRRVPRDIEILQDGRRASVQLSTESDGRQHVARIGSEHATMSGGLHTYTITYTIKGVIEKGEDVAAASQFYWNLIPAGWAQRIDKATLRVNLPTEVEGVDCAVGIGSTGGCTAQGEGTDRLIVKVSDLAPRTPVTIKAGLDMPTPDTGDRRPWPFRWDSVLGGSTSGVAVVLVLALLAGLFAWRREHGSHEKDPAFPLQYAPPPGVGPAQAAYILTEGVPRTALVATLLHMSETGLARLDRSNGQWTLTRTGDAAAWDATDEITRSIGDMLIPAPGSSFTADPSDTGAGQTLRTAVGKVAPDTRHWAARDRHLEISGLGGAGGKAVLAAGIATFVLAVFNPFSMSLIALVPGLFLVGGMYLARSGSGTRRTASGRDLWSRLGGFRRVLSTPSSESRFDFSGRKDLYTAYIPWAVAFGVADKWAAKYRTEVGEEPPVPSYFGSRYGYSTGMYVDSMVAELDQSISSSISAYEASIAPQFTSSGTSGFSGWSGGGGGFSGGGGGGGGGGGSW